MADKDYAETMSEYLETHLDRSKTLIFELSNETMEMDEHGNLVPTSYSVETTVIPPR